MTFKRGLVQLCAVISVASGLGVTASFTPASAGVPGTNGRIAFESGRYGGTQNIFTMRSDGSDVRQLTFYTASQGAALYESWSPDGSKIVFGWRNADASVQQIIVMNRDGSNQHLLFSDRGYFDRFPGYSPSGKRVVFARCQLNGEACAIYTVGVDGNGMTAVTHLNPTRNVLDVLPEYSPDGRRIAFTSFHRGGIIAAIYLVDTSGSHVVRITPPWLEASEPDWAPDGTHLIFATHCCNPQPSAIWSVRADATGLQQISHPGASHDFTPEYASSGHRIAFERDAPDFSTTSILTMNAAGSDVATIQADAFTPAWGSRAEGE